MPDAEIAAGITSVRAAMDLAKAMLQLRDLKLVAAKADELRLALSDVLGKLIDAQQAQIAQLEEIQALKAEAANFGSWEAEKERCELEQMGNGAVARMLKPSARGEQA